MTTTLRVVTGAPPRRATRQNPNGGRHGYTCPCTECASDKRHLAPKVCECLRPQTYIDDETGDRRCTCGRSARPARGPTQLPRAA